jgi:hypothetical protein
VRQPGVNHDGSRFTQNKLYRDETRAKTPQRSSAGGMVYQTVFVSNCTACAGKRVCPCGVLFLQY